MSLVAGLAVTSVDVVVQVVITSVLTLVFGAAVMPVLRLLVAVRLLAQGLGPCRVAAGRASTHLSLAGIGKGRNRQRFWNTLWHLCCGFFCLMLPLIGVLMRSAEDFRPANGHLALARL